MREILSDTDTTPYAILSHTWEAEQEVSFQQWENQENADITNRSGYLKIKQFCAQAAHDGFEWAWIDT
jgi:hypothetical protein